MTLQSNKLYHYPALDAILCMIDASEAECSEARAVIKIVILFDIIHCVIRRL